MNVGLSRFGRATGANYFLAAHLLSSPDGKQVQILCILQTADAAIP
jgi:hypothetical protein